MPTRLLNPFSSRVDSRSSFQAATPSVFHVAQASVPRENVRVQGRRDVTRIPVIVVSKRISLDICFPLELHLCDRLPFEKAIQAPSLSH